MHILRWKKDLDAHPKVDGHQNISRRPNFHILFISQYLAKCLPLIMKNMAASTTTKRYNLAQLGEKLLCKCCASHSMLSQEQEKQIRKGVLANFSNTKRSMLHSCCTVVPSWLGSTGCRWGRTRKHSTDQLEWSLHWAPPPEMETSLWYCVLFCINIYSFCQFTFLLYLSLLCKNYYYHLKNISNDYHIYRQSQVQANTT